MKWGWYIVHGLTGVHLSTPTHYLDWSMMSATFPADIEKVKERLPSEHMKPIQSTLGASVTFRAMEVRNVIGIPPYNEFAVEVPVVYESGKGGAPLPGIYILHMPVTAEEARWGGVDIYGLPKFIADVSFEDVGDVCRCRVQAGGKDIVTLEVEKLAVESSTWDWYLYGVRDGQLLRSHLRTEGLRGVAETTGGALFTLGDHVVSDGLRSLGIKRLSTAHEFGLKLRSLEGNPVIITSLKH